MPLYRDPRSDMPVTQYSLKWVEPAGLVKFDFLGLKTLTTIDYAVRMINKGGKVERPLDIDNIPIEDEETYQLYQRGDTFGIFQFESPGMRRALIDLVPDRIEDLIAMNALYRPGPMDNIPSFVNRKHEREDTSVLHELMEPILAETYGIIVYQEQVMQIAQVLSGYSLGEADMLRRAMGKKIKAEMDRQRDRFRSGALEKGIKAGAGRHDLRLARQIRQLRLQQEPCRRLCLGQLPDGVSKGAFSARILRRLHDARHGARPTSFPISAARRRRRASRWCRPASTGPKCSFRVKRGPDLLQPVRGQGRRKERRRTYRCGARRQALQ